MAADLEDLVAFLAREHDATANAAGGCPDENVWAALEAGLISPAGRDELLSHARACGPCRRRMSGIVAEWPEEISIAETADGAQGKPLPHGLPLERSEKGRGSDRGVLFRIAPRYYAIAAALVLGVTLWLTWPAGRPDAGILGTPIARLTDFGDIGILQRRTLSERPDPRREEVSRLAAELGDYASKRPDDAEAWQELALANVRLGSLDEARRAIDRALSLELGRADRRNVLGMIEYRAGRFDKAAAAFSEAVRLDSARADYHLNAALALEEIEQVDAAVGHWREFLRLAPEDPRAAEAARWLEVLEAGLSADPDGT